VAFVEVAVVLVVLLGLGTLLLGASRLRTLSGRVGSFVCGAYLAKSAGGAAAAGIAQYGAGRLDWWRSWSLALRPTRSWQRRELLVIGRERFVSPGRPDLYLVRCRYHGVDFALTMSPDAFAGLTSWLEAAPPSPLSSTS